jgi:hypothetical protein
MNAPLPWPLIFQQKKKENMEDRKEGRKAGKGEGMEEKMHEIREGKVGRK